MNNVESVKEVAEDLQKFQLQLCERINTYEQLHREIAARINYLVANDFSLLISILYRLDISEKKLKQLLSEEKQTAAGGIIATMIIERQIQKIEARKNFKSNGCCEEERW